MCNYIEQHNSSITINYVPDNVCKLSGPNLLYVLLIKSNYLFQLAADPDPNVKNGAELLDRLIKVGQQWKFISEMQISNMQFKYLNFLMMVGQGVH